MERRWRTRRNHAGVNGIGIGLCFRSRRSCYEKIGKRVEAGLCIACGKEPCECKNLRASPPETRAARNNLARQFVLPEAQTEAEFPKGVPGGRGVGFLEYRYNASVAILPDMRHSAHGSSARFRTPAGPQESFMPTRPDSSCPCWFPSRTLLRPSARANAWASPRESAT